MNISQWKIGDRTFFSLEVDDRHKTIHLLRKMFLSVFSSSSEFRYLEGGVG